MEIIEPMKSSALTSRTVLALSLNHIIPNKKLPIKNISKNFMEKISKISSNPCSIPSARLKNTKKLGKFRKYKLKSN